jgi:hypothetical protein
LISVIIHIFGYKTVVLNQNFVILKEVKNPVKQLFLFLIASSKDFFIILLDSSQAQNDKVLFFFTNDFLPIIQYLHYSSDITIKMGLGGVL